jgi:hypothetical protein
MNESQQQRVMIVFASDGARHTLVFYLGISLHAQVASSVYEYRHPTLPPLWIAVAYDTLSMVSALDFATRNRCNVHNYTRQGMQGPGGLHTIQTWIGDGTTVRQRYGDELAWYIQRGLPGPSPSQPYRPVSPLPNADDDAAELERVLARSLESYAMDQGRRSPCLAPAWVEPLRGYKSEPAIPGVHPTCLACLESRATLAFVDCGHQVMCDECACDFWSQPGGPKRQCLVCRKPIQHAPIHLFPSEPIPVNKDQPMV